MNGIGRKKTTHVIGIDMNCIYSQSMYKDMEMCARNYRYNRRPDWRWMMNDKQMFRRGHFEVLYRVNWNGPRKARWTRRKSYVRWKKVGVFT